MFQQILTWGHFLGHPVSMYNQCTFLIRGFKKYILAGKSPLWISRHRAKDVMAGESSTKCDKRTF